MKHQYFGDINDFRKYGLLRALQNGTTLTLAVGWMLTPNDGSTDGGKRQYLSEPNRWRHHDEHLFDYLSSFPPDQIPSGKLPLDSTVLPRTRFFNELVPDNRLERVSWGRRLVEFSTGADLVFLDPDNGIEIPSKPIGRKHSSKYAAWAEIENLWVGGSSLLIYQHFCRRPRDIFTANIVESLRHRIEADSIRVFRTPHVMFVLAIQPRHLESFEEAVQQLSKWKNQVEMVF